MEEPGFGELARSGSAGLRATLITNHLDMAHRLARRFARRPDAVDDLQQVAALGLVKAVDGFRPELGTPFAAYAVSTIVGELKRHQRDKGWVVRAPRRVQELYLAMQHEAEVLTQQLSRPPRPSELAERMGVSEEAVLEATEAAQGLRCASLDSPAADDGTPLVERLGDEDGALGQVDGVATVADGMRLLPARERRILYLHFFEGLTQAEVARRVGLSQMQVSRLIRSSLELLRREAAERERPAGGGPLRAIPTRGAGAGATGGRPALAVPAR